MSGSDSPASSNPTQWGHAVLRWRLPAFGVIALVGLVALAAGWATVRDGWYLTGIVLSALGLAGVVWVLAWRRPHLAVAAIAVVGVVTLGLGLGAPWWQVASAYSHDGQVLRESAAEPEDAGFLLVRDHQLFSVDDRGAMYPWWEGTVRRETQVSRTGGDGVVIYHGPNSEGIVYRLDPGAAEPNRWRFDLPQERESTWWDGGVVSVTPRTVVTHWCDSDQDCHWTGHDAQSGEQVWTAAGIPVPNAGLGRMGVSSAGPHATADGFWVGIRTESGAVQLRDPDTGSVVHTVEAEHPVALAGARAVVGRGGEDACEMQVLSTDDGDGQDGEDAEASGPPSAEVHCDVVHALVQFPAEEDYLDGDLLWLPGTSESHVIDLGTAQWRTVTDRVFGARSSTTFYGPGGSGSWTAGAGVLSMVDAHRVHAHDPLTGESLWQTPLPGALARTPVAEAPVVHAAGGVVTVQVPAQPWVLEESVTGSDTTPMVLHAFDARTGEELMPPLRHTEGPDSIEIHAGRLLFTVADDAEGPTTYLFGADDES